MVIHKRRIRRRHIAARAVLTALLVMAMLAGCGGEQYRIINVSEVSGQVSVVEESSEYRAYPKMHLQEGHTVVTSGGSYTRMVLDEDKYIKLEEGSRAAVQALANGRTEINLERGAITNEIVKPLFEGQSYIVNTPNATLAVRGTYFRVELDRAENGDLLTKVFTYGGTVVSQRKLPDGTLVDEEVLISAGHRATISTDAEKTVYLEEPVYDVIRTVIPMKLEEISDRELIDLYFSSQNGHELFEPTERIYRTVTDRGLDTEKYTSAYEQASAMGLTGKGTAPDDKFPMLSDAAAGIEELFGLHHAPLDGDMEDTQTIFEKITQPIIEMITGEEPEEAPVTEEQTPAGETPVIEEQVSAEKVPVTEERLPAEEVPPAAEILPSPPPAEVPEIQIPTEEQPPAEEIPSVEEVPPTEEIPPAEEVPPTEEIPPVEEVPPTEEIPPVEEVPPTEEILPPPPPEEVPEIQIPTQPEQDKEEDQDKDPEDTDKEETDKDSEDTEEQEPEDPDKDIGGGSGGSSGGGSGGSSGGSSGGGSGGSSGGSSGGGSGGGSGGSTDTVCAHSNITSHTSKAPTCMQTGIQTYTCVDCHEVQSTTTLPINASNHSTLLWTIPATCTAAGYFRTTCTNTDTDGNLCTYELIEENAEAPALGHDMLTPTLHPCQSGEVTATCQNTGCDYSETVTVAATASHVNGVSVETTAATCISEGERTTTCTVCGEVTNIQVIAKTAHTAPDGATEAETTCAVDGCNERMINLNSTEFDSAFAYYLKSESNGYDYQLPQGYLVGEELTALQTFGIGVGSSEHTITSLKGIENLDTIQHLKLENCYALTAAPLANMPNLQTVSVNGCSALTGINLINSSSLQELTLTNLPYLTGLNLTNSGLKKLNVNSGTDDFWSNFVTTGCSDLEINYSSYNIENFTLSGKTPVKSLSVNSGSVKTVDVSGCTNMQSLTFTDCYGLQTINVSDTALTELDVSNCSALTEIKVGTDGLTAGDITLPFGVDANIIVP